MSDSETQKSQLERFEDAAKAAGVDIDESALKAALRQIGQHKPKPDGKDDEK